MANHPITKETQENVLPPFVWSIIMTASVIATPILGASGPFSDTAQGNAPMEEYFAAAAYAFSIWGIIYGGFIAWAVWVLLPGQRTNDRVQGATPWLAASAAFNLLWMFLAGSTTLVAWTTPVIVLMGITAFVAYFRLGINNVRTAESSPDNDVSSTERLLHIPFRIYVGWLCIATVANSAATLNALQWNGFGISPVTWALMMIGIATVVASAAARLLNEDNLYRTVFVWAFIAIAVKRWGTPEVAYTAIGSAIVVSIMIVASIIRYRQLKAKSYVT
jgi:translocator protein